MVPEDLRNGCSVLVEVARYSSIFIQVGYYFFMFESVNYNLVDLYWNKQSSGVFLQKLHLQHGVHEGNIISLPLYFSNCCCYVAVFQTSELSTKKKEIFNLGNNPLFPRDFWIGEKDFRKGKLMFEAVTFRKRIELLEVK